MSKPKLLVISTGGTITMTAADRAGGIAPTLTADDLLASVPGIGDLAQIETITFSTVPGASLQLPKLLELGRYLSERSASDIDGAIVIQGTDTIEETAFLLDMLYVGQAPVVVTGAMRGAHMAGADGPANMLAGAVVACAASSRDRGVLVVMNDEVHSARYARKSHTGLTSSFVSTHAGPIGLVWEKQVTYFVGRTGVRKVLPTPPAVAQVAVVKVCLGDDARLLDALAGLHYQGVIVEAMGAGHVPETWAPKLETLAATMPTVLSVRTTDGPVFRTTYGFVGSETDLIQRGLIPGGFLGALKSRLLLGVLMGNGLSREAIRDTFNEWGYLTNAG